MYAVTGLEPQPCEKRETGATLVEFALALPLLLILLLGIIEYGYVFAQQVEVRHAAREGARLAAVDFGADADAATSRANLVEEICSRLNLVTIAGGADIDVELTLIDIDGDGEFTEGDGHTVSIDAPIRTLTSFLDWAVPDSSFQSVVDSRIEQAPTWTDGTESC